MKRLRTEGAVSGALKPALRIYHWAFLVHLWTLTGLAFAVFALKATMEGEFDTAARLLIGVLLVDFSDGTFARWLRVKERMPLIAGEVIDYIHDLVGLTLVPMVFFWKAGLFVEPWGFPLAVVATLSATLKYGMKASVLRLGYSIGAPPIFFSIFLCYFLELGPLVSTLYAAGLIVLTLLPVPFPITSLVTTHWQPGWQSITNYLVTLCVLPVLFWLREAPKAIYWLLLVNVVLQVTVFPLLLRAEILKPGFNRRF
jgi:phosphatidylcholine synthase